MSGILWLIIGNMGKGKTQLATIKALDYAKKHPNAKIYANYFIKTKNFVYSPYILLPFSELKNALIIADDFYALKTAEGLVEVISCFSRKMNLEIVLTSQYYTDFNLKLRTLADYIIYPDYSDVEDCLRIKALDFENRWHKRTIEDSVKRFGGFYNTNEVVKFPSDRIMEIEIMKNSRTLEDLETNCAIVFKNRATQKKVFERLREKLSFIEVAS